MSARKIEHVTLGVTDDISIALHGWATIFIHRLGDGEHVHIYHTTPRWTIDRQARRVRRFVRILDGFTKSVMTREL